MEKKKLRYLIRVMPKEKLNDSISFLRNIAGTCGISAVNPKITSRGEVELDLFSERSSDVELFVSVIEPLFRIEFLRDLNQPQEYMTDEQAVSTARALFNSERYWEAHEVLESLWRRKSGQEKRLVQSIILVCAAFVHLQKKEEDVALSIMKRSYEQIKEYSSSYMGINVDELKKNLEQIIKKGRVSRFLI